MEDDQSSSSEVSSNTPRSQLAPSTLSNKFQWRLIHGISYLIGGITFAFASVSYFPVFARVVNSANLAGWLYTVGSLSFLIADLLEWEHYRPICFTSSIRSEQYKTGFNFLLSAIGSLLYLIGSILFIPSTNALEVGEVLFIVGSAVIALSQAWKCHRTCMTPHIRSPIENIKDDIPGFCVDLFAGLGGLFYLIGTIVFSKANDITDSAYVPAVILFTLGGISFLVSGLFMQKRYFFRSADDYMIFR